MSKSILIGLEGSPCSASATEVALAVAESLSATLVAVAVVDEPAILAGTPTGTGGGAAYKQHRDTVLLQDAHAHAEGWLNAFAQHCAAEHRDYRTLELRGSPGNALLEQMEQHDLTVLGRLANFKYETQDGDAQTETFVLHRTQKPVIVVPEGAIIRRRLALVAYDGSAASVRAIKSFAESGLAKGYVVHVTAVDDDGIDARQMALRGVELLRTLNVPAIEQGIVSAAPIGDAILERAEKLGAGLVVMGAYKRSRFKELIWGSVTTDILEKATLPVFVRR